MQKNSRPLIPDIAKQVNLSENGVRYRFGILEQEWYIQNYVVSMKHKKFRKKNLLF
ncbi:MAG: hypothetical protein JXA38_04510 [Methanosarcinaceae archaeon]|nr:hypothetical protein [Methanosarcinaceae archaeon]